MSEDPHSPFIVDPLDDSIGSCLNNVENSDVLICIIDRRYGGILRTAPYEGLCETQIEVRRARDTGRPCFFFIRELAWNDYQHLRGDISRASRWVEPDNIDNKRKWVDFVTEASAIPVTAGISNWRDTFTASTDLKALVLKRLSDHFPEHLGVIAMHPDRLVRLHFVFVKSNPMGPIMGHFRNVGIGPALNITHGLHVGDHNVTVFTEGALAEKEDLVPPNEDECHYASNWPASPVVFCEYDNRFGDRYRVELPFVMNSDRFEPSPPERFSVVS